MKKLRECVDKLFQGRYGMDDLGKMIMSLNLIFYLLGVILKSEFLISLSVIIFFISLYRILSRQHWDRREENRKYMSYVKLWKLKYENRKYSRVFICKRCGKYIRVPKGKGKIQVTCKSCGDKTICRT